MNTSDNPGFEMLYDPKKIQNKSVRKKAQKSIIRKLVVDIPYDWHPNEDNKTLFVFKSKTKRKKKRSGSFGSSTDRNFLAFY